jgi:hypothetical protein
MSFGSQIYFFSIEITLCMRCFLWKSFLPPNHFSQTCIFEYLWPNIHLEYSLSSYYLFWPTRKDLNMLVLVPISYGSILVSKCVFRFPNIFCFSWDHFMHAMFFMKTICSTRIIHAWRCLCFNKWFYQSFLHSWSFYLG